MTTALLLSLFASTYGSGTYNTGVYNGAATSDSSGGTLSNTGILIGLIIGVSALILLTAMVVRIWKRPNRKQPTESEED